LKTEVRISLHYSPINWRDRQDSALASLFRLETGNVTSMTLRSLP
jgi:hypothetical protein